MHRVDVLTDLKQYIFRQREFEIINVYEQQIVYNQDNAHLNADKNVTKINFQSGDNTRNVSDQILKAKQ